MTIHEEAAFDLSNLGRKPHRNHVGGCKVRPVAMMTPLGPSICVEVTPIMTSGEERKPLLFDIEGWLGLNAMMSGTYLTTMQSANAQAAVTAQAKAEAKGLDLSYLRTVGAEGPDTACTCGPRGSDGPAEDCPTHGRTEGDQAPPSPPASAGADAPGGDMPAATTPLLTVGPGEYLGAQVVAEAVEEYRKGMGHEGEGSDDV